MSVTLVSPPSTPAQPAATDTATSSDATTTSGDFANVLQNQLELATTDAASQLLAAELPATEKKASDKDRSMAEQGADGTSLLATLALVTPSVSNVGTTSTTSSEQSSSSALSALSAASPLDRGAQAKDALDTLKTARQTTEATETTRSDDAAAKVAVAPVAVDEFVDAKKTAKDTESIDTTATNHTGHAHTPRQQEASATSLSVATPVRDQEWASDFSQQVVWLASADKQSAQLTLNPEQMGPIEISVSLDKGSASVSFTSANAEVRDAIETALPKLREMFASAGIELGQTNVGSGAFQQQAGNGQNQPSSSRLTADNAILGADTWAPLQSTALSAHRGNGLVDLFA